MSVKAATSSEEVLELLEKAPTLANRYRIGAFLNKEIDHVCTLDDIGESLGITRYDAYHECAVALGTFVWCLYSGMPLPQGFKSPAEISKAECA